MNALTLEKPAEFVKMHPEEVSSAMRGLSTGRLLH